MAPAKLEANVIGTLSVRLLPDTVTAADAMAMLHWLLPNVVDAPTVAGANQPLPASLYRYNWLAARSRYTIHEFSAWPIVSPVLNQNHVWVRSVAPLLSAYWNVKVCCAAPPDVGAADTTDTTGLTVAVTVHVPKVCHPLLTPADAPYAYVFFAPAKLEANVIGTLSVRLLPDAVTAADPMAMLHWLLPNVVDAPTAAGGNAPLPASLYRYN